MNERIKELSKEAFEYALSQRPGSDEFQPIWTEKFAELIVRECTTIMHEDTSPNCPYVDYFKVTNKVKQHFGDEL